MTARVDGCHDVRPQLEGHRLGDHVDIRSEEISDINRGGTDYDHIFLKRI